MQWLDIAGFEGYYQISDSGLVRSFHRCLLPRLLKPYQRGRYGHLSVVLTRNRKQVAKQIHRLVLETFVGPCPDGKVGNNNVDNLYWGTRQDNVNDAIRHGTHNQYYRL